jgi:hypothetical protein
LAKATGLDPMHGKNFNKPTVNDYFNQMAGIKEKYGDILASQIWNMDEKGIQLGGGMETRLKEVLLHEEAQELLQAAEQ